MNNGTIQSIPFTTLLLAGAVSACLTAQTPTPRFAGPISTPIAVADRALAEAGCGQHRCGASLGAQFDHADLVFEGVVRKVECRLSDPSEDGTAPRLPVTYVTFDIVETFWGIAPQREPGRITIRVLGGPAPDGRVLEVSGRPLFGVGQHDVLFVRQNHRGVASVLHGSNRRFRVRGDEVFFESGREILASREGELLPGRRHEIPEFRRVEIGGQVIEQVAGGDDEAVAVAADDKLRISAVQFRAVLRRLAQGASAAKVERTRLVGDVSIRDRFALAKQLRERARDVDDAHEVESMPAEERAERDAEARRRAARKEVR